MSPARSWCSAVVCAALAGGGCATSPEARAPEDRPAVAALEGAPSDFSLDLMALPPASAEPVAGAGPGVGAGAGAYTPPIARCVVFPDATLHARRDGGLHERRRDLLPPYRCTLTLAQLDSLWAMCRELGRSGAEPWPGREPVEGVACYSVVVTGGGERWTYVERVPAGALPGAALMALFQHAANLAWVDGRRDEGPPPRRYDFGPDPYAPYRRP
jgi:hypothetical protein